MMKIQVLAADSMGVRSISTFVEANGVKIHIDPGAALGPKRYGLPPHPIELRKLEDSLKTIRKFAKKSEFIFITHYHYDHYVPDDASMYTGKNLWIKHPKENINASQKSRAKNFLEVLDEKPKVIEFADGRGFEVKGVKVKFSPAVWHGPENSKVGRVVMVSIDDGKQKFVFGSDAQGLLDPKALGWVIKENPDIALIDGPPTIFIGWRMGKWILEDSIKNLKELLSKTKVKTVILDHHVVRDIEYKKKMREVFEYAEKLGKKVVNAAEFMGVKPEYLEALRKELYEKY